MEYKLSQVEEAILIEALRAQIARGIVAADIGRPLEEKMARSFQMKLNYYPRVEDGFGPAFEQHVKWRRPFGSLPE